MLELAKTWSEKRDRHFPWREQGGQVTSKSSNSFIYYYLVYFFND
jgi:hypothetical protein